MIIISSNNIDVFDTLILNMKMIGYDHVFREDTKTIPIKTLNSFLEISKFVFSKSLISRTKSHFTGSSPIVEITIRKMAEDQPKNIASVNVKFYLQIESDSASISYNNFKRIDNLNTFFDEIPFVIPKKVSLFEDELKRTRSIKFDKPL